MKIFILFFFLLLTLYGSSSSKETCFTVQLLSKHNSEENRLSFEKNSYPKICKIMAIGRSLTVRCGCVEKKIKANEILNRMKNEYQQAMVITTYSYRFAEPKSKKENKKVILPEKLVKKLKLKPIKRVKKEKTKKLEVTTDIEDINSTEIVISSYDDSDVTVIENNEPFKRVKKSKKEQSKKEKKREKKKSKKSKKKKHKKSKIKKEKKLEKKPKKVKYVKKRAKRYFYNRYFNLLESRESSGSFDYRYRFGAQLSYDSVYVNEADRSYEPSNWRRVRVFHKGDFLDRTLFYDFEYSLINSGRYKNVYLGYQNRIKSLNASYRLKGGNIKIPFSLENYTSSKYTMFMERALTDAFSTGRKLGAEVLLSTKYDKNRVNLFLSTFTNSINDQIDNKVNLPGYSLRLTYSYSFNKRDLLSVGTAFMYQDINHQDIKFKQGAESDFIMQKYVSTKVKNIFNTKKNNLEVLYIKDKFSFQSEYTNIEVSAQVDRYNFSAYYIEGSYFIIGRGRRYKVSNSSFSNVKPTAEGAVELALRYSYIDLTDSGETGVNPEEGGTQTDYSYGVNWYFSKELKMALNYIVAEPKNTDDYSGLYQVIQARVLFAF